MAMLVPAVAQSTGASDFQTATVTLPGPGKKSEMGDDCTIRGEAFSLHASLADNRSWVVRTPSASGWEKLSGQMDLQAQSRLFLAGLARLHDRGCFPPSVDTQSVRSAIAARIPLPADRVASFMFSDQGTRFVNLSAGMTIRIQKVLSTAGSATPGPLTTVRLLTVDYDVVEGRSGGVRLQLGHHQVSGSRQPLRPEDRELFALERQFASASALRLFLKGFSEEKLGRSESDALLIGSSGNAQLDAFTERIRQKSQLACVPAPGVLCADLPSGSVSLFSLVFVNGTRTPSPFGAPLGLLLFSPPLLKASGILNSVQVQREVSPHRYGTIQFPRTEDGARQLLLLPGDRIDWKE